MLIRRLPLIRFTSIVYTERYVFKQKKEGGEFVVLIGDVKV